jgi:hypothetical protein
MKNLILLLFVFASAEVCGQTEKMHGVDVYLFFGDNQDFKYKSLMGEGSYNGKYYCGVSLEWIQKLSKRWDFSTGFAYTFNRTDYEAMSVGDDWMQRVHRSENRFLLSIPFLFRIHFLKYLFANGGASLHLIQASAFGIGPKLGVGLKYVFDSGLSITLNPYVEWVISSRHLIHQGARIGVGYRF